MWACRNRAKYKKRMFNDHIFLYMMVFFCTFLTKDEEIVHQHSFWCHSKFTFYIIFHHQSQQKQDMMHVFLYWPSPNLMPVSSYFTFWNWRYWTTWCIWKRDEYEKNFDVEQLYWLFPFRTLHKNKAPLEIGDTYWCLRESVARCELYLLRALQFKVEFNHPHKVLYTLFYHHITNYF